MNTTKRLTLEMVSNKFSNYGKSTKRYWTTTNEKKRKEIIEAHKERVPNLYTVLIREMISYFSPAEWSEQEVSTLDAKMNIFMYVCLRKWQPNYSTMDEFEKLEEVERMFRTMKQFLTLANDMSLDNGDERVFDGAIENVNLYLKELENTRSELWGLYWEWQQGE